MSYPIVFQTKVLNLGDGRIIHFDRSGCNNDTEGREKGVFRAYLYTADAFKKKAQEYMDGSKPYKNGGEFDLKIGSRTCSMYDYGKHLLRALKNADTLETFKQYIFRAERFTGIEVIEPFNKFYPCETYPNVLSDIMVHQGEFEGVKGNIIYRQRTEDIYEIMDCIPHIVKGNPMQFHILKREISKWATQ